MTPFAELCLLVRIALHRPPDAAERLAAAPLDADALIALSMQQKVAPFLGILAADPELGGHLPAPLREALIVVHEANADRNNLIRAEIAAIAEALNGGGIEPVLLKGAARLFDGSYPDGRRFLLDLDILVPAARLDIAARSLAGAGFVPFEQAGLPADELHHVPNLWREGEPACVEIHRAPVSHWRSRLLPAEAMIANSVAVDAGGHRARVPAFADALVHLIAHGQLQDYRHLGGGVALSDVVECWLLVRRGGAAALQQALDRATAAGWHGAFAAFLCLCEAVGGEPLPVEGHRTRLARWSARRALWQQDRQAAQRLGSLAVRIARNFDDLRHYPSIARRLPGRLIEAEFYRHRWDELRRAIRGGR